MSRVRTPLIAAVAAAAACTASFVGVGTVAAVGDPSLFPHSATSVPGKVEITVTNQANADVSCEFSLYPLSELADARNFAETMNRFFKQEATGTELQVAGFALEGRQAVFDVTVPAGQTRSASVRPTESDSFDTAKNTTFAATQICVNVNSDIPAEDSVAAMTAYVIEGASTPGAQVPGTGSLDAGSLGSLLP